LGQISEASRAARHRHDADRRYNGRGWHRRHYGAYQIGGSGDRGGLEKLPQAHNYCAACPFRELHPHVFMMQPAKNWNGRDVADPLYLSSQWRIHLEWSMPVRLILISCISKEHLA
jgi:hypothetical protein